MAARLRAGGRDDVLFVGTPDGLEARLVPEAGVPFEAVPARGFDRSRPLSLLTAAAVDVASALRAWRLLGRVRPDVVLGFGGFVSLPVGLAAVLRRVPLVIAEQNSVPGSANRLLSRWARSAAVTYPGSERYLAHPERAVLTGNPVRTEVLEASREEGRRRFGLAAEDLVLLVFGGSRGARHINEATLALRPRLAALPRLRVLHVAGRMEAPAARERLAAEGGAEGAYRVLDYVDDMGMALAAADLVVARAGATSIAEITALGRPSVLVPYPHATDDHQTKNARAVEAAGGALVVADAALDAPAYGEAVLGLLADAAKRETMGRAAAELGRPQAAEAVVALAREAHSEGAR